MEQLADGSVNFKTLDTVVIKEYRNIMFIKIFSIAFKRRQLNSGIKLFKTSNSPKILRISGKPFLWLAVLPFLAITTSHAQNLPDFSGLIEQEGDAVVKISVVTESPRGGFAGIPGLDFENLPPELRQYLEQSPNFPSQPRQQSSGFGSGFIISEDGYVITNAHVVDNASEIVVGLQDQREFDATLVGSDTTSDIAVLKLDATNLPVVKLGDSDNLKTGQWVLAIGSPFGFEHTATQGIVSALARSLPEDTYVPFIQTDVAVNPGNSGGPLFNVDGEVVGVNSQIFSRSGGYQGLSFAIPINVAMAVANQIQDNGFATRGWLGVQIQTLSQELAEAYELDRPRGAFVAAVVGGSPALKAGVEVEDIILEFNGKPVRHADALPPLVGSVVPGSKAEMLVLRNGQETTLMVTIETLAADRQVASSSSSAGSATNETSRLGVAVAVATPEELEAAGVDFGVIVNEVEPGSPAAEAGIRPADVISSYARTPITSVAKLGELLKRAPSGKAIPMRVYREGAAVFLAVTVN